MTPEQRKMLREALDEMEKPPNPPTIKFCISNAAEQALGDFQPLQIKLQCDEFIKDEVKAMQI